ncbi:MAG: RrF2 family transcriptional regulator [Dehalococcoidales bacterium]|nr:RrF2 family transcriptional regulator [Dehalococcoidales bacterium]
MKVSTKGQYGTRLLLDLAMHLDEERVLLRDIASRQDISLFYLERIIAPLVAAGIVRTTRGPKGGISLAKPPEQINLSEVIQLLEGSTAPVECVNDPAVCNRSDMCATRDIWGELKKQTDSMLESITIHDLVERQKQKFKAEKPMYFI